MAEIPKDKPKDIIWDAEWAARHMDFRFPEVTDSEFLAAFKKVMIEVSGDRMYDYRAAEQVEEYLVAGGHTCPNMEKEAASEGFSRYSKIKDFIRLQLDVVRGAASKWRGHDPIHLKMWPAWSLETRGITTGSDYRERWEKVGGKFFKPLGDGSIPDMGESKMIALKTDSIWKRLGDPAIFPDALGIDHPPFCSGPGLSWGTVNEIEAIAIGLIQSDLSPQVIESLIQLHLEQERSRAEILEQSLKESREAYAQMHSPEAMLAKEEALAKWWMLLDFANGLNREIRNSISNGSIIDQQVLDERIKQSLLHKRLNFNPRVKAILHRALGDLGEASGNHEEAKTQYRLALSLDSKVGCKRDLTRLVGQKIG